MLKITFVAALLSLSFSAFSQIELRSQVNSQSCVIKGDKVTKTVAYKGGEYKFETTETVKFHGLDKLARTVAESGTSSATDVMNFELILDGQTHAINDSTTEGIVLLNMMSRLCNFR